jgi:DNA-binding MarR family transcriptional regulator
MSSIFQCQLNQHDLIKTDPILEEIEEAALDSAQLPAIDGLLRALTGSILNAAATMRFENLEPYERTLDFVAGQVANTLEDLDNAPLHQDPRYILGRIDGLLDACDMAIDRSVSTVIVEGAGKRRYVYSILELLHRTREMRASDLADAVHIKPNHLSNILKWMEESGLVRRATIGRSTIVSMGPKGNAVYDALRNGKDQGMQVEDFDLAKPDSERSRSISALTKPTAA